MDDKAVSEILHTFSTYQRAFTTGEALSFADSDCGVTAEALGSAFMNSTKFMCLGRADPGGALLIAQKDVIRWLINLNNRLAIAGQCRLNKRKLALLTDSLGIAGDADVALEAIVRFGQQFGLVGYAYTQDQYVFPIAHILSFTTRSAVGVATSIIADLLDRTGSNLSFEDDPKQMVINGLAKFSPRVAQVVQSREGLLAGGKMTLEQIGGQLGVTRERVRQIETRFWEALRRDARRPPFKLFMAALLRGIIIQQGSLVVDLNSANAAYIKFTCKCAGIPYADLADAALVIVGASPDNLEQLQLANMNSIDFDAITIAERLESLSGIYLIGTDIALVAENLYSLKQKHLNRYQQVYLTLKKIGKPAHYSEIAEVYNNMFPQYRSTEYNIHAVLNHEQNGVVWVGIRGTFALAEWGYEHPDQGLHESVAEIVNHKFLETGKPVHFNVISSEISKYRSLVKPSSLFFAASFNPAIRCVSKDLYVPALNADHENDEPTADELDKKLREWEQKNKDIGCQTDN